MARNVTPGMWHRVPLIAATELPRERSQEARNLHLTTAGRAPSEDSFLGNNFITQPVPEKRSGQNSFAACYAPVIGFFELAAVFLLMDERKRIFTGR